MGRTETDYGPFTHHEHAAIARRERRLAEGLHPGSQTFGRHMAYAQFHATMATYEALVDGPTGASAGEMLGTQTYDHPR